ncbi:MAG: sigma 54-interacting transcriptional regulator [Thermodesulfobacteriota bacterium]
MEARKPLPEQDDARALAARVAQLEELNRDLMGMIENSYDGLCIVDGDSRLLLLNPGFERVMGLDGKEILGRRTADLVREGFSDTSASLKVIETGMPQTVIIRTRAGRQVLSTGVPIFGPDGKVSRIYCNLRDITDLTQLKEKYEQSQKLISRYLIALQEAKQQAIEEHLVAHSAEMRQIIDMAFRIARVDATVLLLGESGVGKERVARMIHEASPRAEAGPFVKINCGAIPADLLESELFGYEAGAFTGASRDGKLGYFEVADKGTLLLDEVGDLPFKLQVKLLSVLQDSEITRVGGTKPKKVDVRILAATNQDLEKMVRDGVLREDLYYRLSVVPVVIPPLRERKADIPFLLHHYLETYGRKYAIPTRLDKEALEALCRYRWPGNVRELANLMEHLVVVAREPLIRPEHLPRKYRGEPEGDREEEGGGTLPLRTELRRHEQRIIRRAVSRSKTLEEAAHGLGISLSTLTRRLRMVRSDGQS